MVYYMKNIDPIACNYGSVGNRLQELKVLAAADKLRGLEYKDGKFKNVSTTQTDDFVLD